MKQRGTIIAVVLLVVSAALRVPGAFDQPWLDEIWSMNLAREAHGLGAIFTSLNVDNNHWLNTVWLYAVRGTSAWWPMHLLSLVSGIATPIVTFVWARRTGGAGAGIAAVVLVGFSEMLIEYSSEARGYAPATCCCAAAILLATIYLQRPTGLTALGLSLVWTLGLLSHLSFLGVWVATAAAIAVGLILQQGARSRFATLSAIIKPNLVPMAVLVMLWKLELRHWERGGGPPTASNLAAITAADLLGVPLVIALAVGVIVVGLCIWQVERLARQRDAIWVAFAGTILLVPFFLAVLPRTEYLHPRYLLVALVPTLMLLALWLGQELDAGGVKRRVAVALLVLYSASNLTRLWPFLQLGRGEYAQAAAFLARNTQGPVVVACDDHPFATAMVLRYDWPYLSNAPPLVIAPPNRIGPPSRWVVLEQNVGARMMDRDAYYQRRATFPCGSPLSGTAWTVYELER